MKLLYGEYDQTYLATHHRVINDQRTPSPLVFASLQWLSLSSVICVSAISTLMLMSLVIPNSEFPTRHISDLCIEQIIFGSLPTQRGACFYILLSQHSQPTIVNNEVQYAQLYILALKLMATHHTGYAEAHPL
jgi:hypothetical protein